MSKVYIIQGSSGSWEDSREWCECAYLSKEKSHDECIKLNKQLEINKEMNETKLNSYNENINSNCSDCMKEDCEDCDDFEEYEYDHLLGEQHSYVVIECELK